MIGPEDYLAELERALDEYRFKDVSRLTEEIVPTEFQDKQIKRALNLLRRKRLFVEVERTAGIFMGAGRATPLVRRYWAQALLDQKRIAQGLSALEVMVQEMKKRDPLEGSEVQGLIGRAYKQLYVNEENPEYLMKAIQAYRSNWKSRKGYYRWDGINFAGLLFRARRDAVDPQTSEDPFQIAKEIRDEIEESGTEAWWDYAIAMEASVALGDEKSALTWAAKYVKHLGVDDFELESTLGQLKVLWQLEGSALGKKLLSVLAYKELNRHGSFEPTSLNNIDSSGFETVWGADSSVRITWFKTMMQRCAAVARVFHHTTGRPRGTGFLVRGDSLNPNWGEGPVFVTNAHVVSNDPADEAPLRPENAAADFTQIPGQPPVKLKLGRLLFSSPRWQLDVTILRVQPPRELSVLTSNELLSVHSQPGDQPQRIYVIGHPVGGELTVTLYDNSLVAYKGDYVHYRSPTEVGHSGSPVFTYEWELIAIHHRAVEDDQANEGVCIGPIRVAASAA